MKRFVIRNYGPSRQFPYKGQSIPIANDSAIETDDEKMAVAFGKQDAVHLTDRGAELASSSSVEGPETSGESEEIVYSDMKVPDLRILAEDRQIKTAGLKKAELIQALENYDTADEQVPEEVLA